MLDLTAIPIIRVLGHAAISQSINYVVQSFMFPANQDIASPGVIVHYFCHTVLIVTIARYIDWYTKVLAERQYRVVRTLFRAI